MLESSDDTPIPSLNVPSDQRVCKQQTKITAINGRPAFIAPPTTYSSNGFNDIESKASGSYHPKNSTEILDHLATGSDLESLRACALVSRSWVPSCRRHLFHTLDLTWGKMDRWLYAFPVPEESPAHHFRELCMTFGEINWFPDKFFEHAPRFTNLRKLSLFGAEDCLGSRLPSLWRLPESVTSLTITGSNDVTLVGVWDIMARLPNCHWRFFLNRWTRVRC